jgi:hypothetical protein
MIWHHRQMPKAVIASLQTSVRAYMGAANNDLAHVYETMLRERRINIPKEWEEYAKNDEKEVAALLLSRQLNGRVSPQ